ncbi:hypothetical protein ABPG72_002551 [Tetrahymena utriculariae]
MDNKKIQQENNVNCTSENNLSSLVNDQLKDKKFSNEDSIFKAEQQPDINVQQDKSLREDIILESSITPFSKNDSKYNKNPRKQKHDTTGYNPFEWPASIEIAKTHELATSLGQELGGSNIQNSNQDESLKYYNQDESSQTLNHQNICPCCGGNANKRPYNWMKTDVTKTLSEKYGTAVPLLFELIKYYGLSILLIFCINGIYSIYVYKTLCDEQPKLCYKMLGFLPILGEDSIDKHLSEGKLSVYRWLNFASYVLILVSQILVDLFCDIREKKLEQFNSVDNLKTTKARTLYITGIPKYKTEEQAMDFIVQKALELTKGEFRVEIVDFFFVRDYSKFHELFQKRTQLYFQTRPLLELTDQKAVAKVEKLKSQTQKINQQLHEVSNEHLTFKGKAFITLSTHAQARQLKGLFPKTMWRKGYTVFLSLIKKISCFQEFATRRQNQIEKMLLMQWAPEAKEINWENLGIKHSDKMQLLTLTFMLSIIAAIFCGVSLTFLSKAIPGFYILIFNITIMIFYSVFLEYLSEKKKGKTKGSKAYFLLSKQGFFILIYFVLLPILYYAFADSDSTGLRTYSLFIFFLINSGIQFLVIIINGKSRAHVSFKNKIKKNPQLANKFCQKELNQKMQKPEFELEQRMIGVMQLWTYSTIHAFLCTYTLLISLLFLIIIYYSCKKMLFTQYSIYNYKTLSLQRKFLSTYSVCFQFAVQYIFQIANHTNLLRILGGSFFAVFYIGYLVFSHYRQAKLKDKRIQELLKEPLLEKNETKGQNTQPQDSYSVLFGKFLQNYELPYLEQEIQNTLEISNPFYQDVLKSFISQGTFFKRTSSNFQG